MHTTDRDELKRLFILRYVPHCLYLVDNARTGKKEWIRIQNPGMLMELDLLLQAYAEH